MKAIAAASPGDALAPLIRHLLAATAQEVDEDVLEGALRRASGDWQSHLEQVLPAVGLQVRWIEGPAALLADEAHRDYPLVTWLNGPGGGWASVSARRFGSPATTLFGRSRDRVAVDERLLFGPHSRPWARIVPMLPATALGGKVSPLRRLLGLLIAERSDIQGVVVLALGIGLFSLGTPLAIQLLINWLAFGALLQPILTLGVGLLLCLLLVATLRSAQRRAVEVVQRRLFVRMVADVSARLARARASGLLDRDGQELANRFFDVVTLQKASATLMLDGLAAALQAAVGAMLLAFYHPALLGFDILAIGLVAIILIPLGRHAESTAIAESKKKYAVADWLEQLAAHPLALRSGPLAERKADRLVHAWLDAREAHFRVYFRQYVGLQSVAVALPVLLLVLTGWLVLEGQLTIGQLVASEFIVTSALAGILKFTEKLETAYDLLAGLDKLGELAGVPMDRLQGAPVPEGPARIELKGVRARHEGAPNGLDGLDLTLAAGSRTAIIGAVGVGKTLLADVLTGIREPAAGKVLRDGIPLSTFHPDELRASSLILRPNGCFAGTLRENLTLGHAMPDDALWEALDKVGLADRVQRLRGHLDARLVGTGPLSSLERHALLVARALLQAPALLVLDGVFEGVPAPTRAVWLRHLGELPSTTVLLTHDPFTATAFPLHLELREGVLHARPRLTTV